MALLLGIDERPTTRRPGAKAVRMVTYVTPDARMRA